MNHEQHALEFTKNLAAYYRRHARPFPWRNRSVTTYQRVVPQVLLQQTRAETVAAMFPAFCRKFPSWRQLSRAKVRELERELKPLGICRRRA
jgi:A/G-specific adenine glycosylase